MTSTTSSVAGAAPGDRAPLDDVTVIILPPAEQVGLDDVVAVLTAVQQQTLAPRRVLVAGFDEEHEDADRVLRHPITTSQGIPLLLRPALGPDAARWEVVEDARRGLPVQPGHWLWFLAPDSRPAPRALAALVAAAGRSSRVGVVGPKLVDADDPRRLLSLGHHLTPAGRATDADAGLVDQGQHDLRQDVLGVALVGSLVDSAVLDAVGGLDRAFGEDGVDGLDLGWRSHLAGHRVVVAADAVVRQGELGLGVQDSRRTRVRQRQVALARGSIWSAPWRAFGVAVTSLVAAVVLLLVKRPAEAAGEWADVRAVLSPARGWGARARFARRRTVSPRDLAGLHSPTSHAWRSTRDAIVDALDPRGRRPRREPGWSGADGPRGGVETGPVSEEFATLGGEGRRSRLSGPLALAVLVSVLVTGWWGRDLAGALHVGGVGLVGPELGPATTDTHGLFASALDGWRGGGLGHDRVAEPWLLPAAAVAWVFSWVPGAGQTVAGPSLAWLLALAAPLSVMTAYLALRRVARGRWVRALLALGWAGLAPLPLALADGRLGPAMVHVLAPLLVTGAAVCAEPEGGSRRTAACFGTVLGIALAALWVPGVLLLATLGGLLLLVLGRRSARWRGGVLAVLPWAFLLPWLPAVLSDPVRLAGGAGGTVAVTSLPPAAPVWQTLLLQPGAPVDVGGLTAVPMWLTIPLWLAALGAVLLPGRAGRRAGVAVTVALLGLAAALVAQRTALGRLPVEDAQAGLIVTAWSGTALTITGAALLLGSGILLDRVLAPAARNRSADEEGRSRWSAGRGWRYVLAVAVLVPTAALGAWGLAPDPRPDALAVATDPLPAVAGEQGRGAAALRTLVLEPAGTDPSGPVLVDLLGMEPEPARILRDRTASLVPPPEGRDEVVRAAELLVSGASPAEVATALTDLGAGYLLLHASADHPLAGQVDRVSGLTRVSSPPDQVLWRWAEADVARVQVLDDAGDRAGRIAVTGPHGQGEGDLSGLPGAAALDVAEGPGWSGYARVLVDGQEMPVSADGRVTLPETAMHAQVELSRPGLPWHLATLVLALVVGFLALPVGRTESRTGPDPVTKNHPPAGRDGTGTAAGET